MKRGFGNQGQERGKVTDLTIVDWEKISMAEDIKETLKGFRCFPITFRLDGECVSCAAKIRVDKHTYTAEIISDPKDPLTKLIVKNNQHIDKIARQIAKKIVQKRPEVEDQIRAVLLSR